MLHLLLVTEASRLVEQERGWYLSLDSDTRDMEILRAIAGQEEQELGQVHIVVTNAGI